MNKLASATVASEHKKLKYSQRVELHIPSNPLQQLKHIL